MASFFQPGFDDLAVNDCQSGKFDVFCNSIVPADRRFAHWYQYVTLTVGGTAILIPILLHILYRVVSSWGDKSSRPSK